MLRIMRIAFVLIGCLGLLNACGSENPTGLTTSSLPKVETVSIKDGEWVSKLVPITVTFTKEMSYVEIQVDGANGITTVNGNTAVWTPITETLCLGSHSISIIGMDESGQHLANPEVIHFVAVTPSPQEIIEKTTAADLWFPGDTGSQWVYLYNNKEMTSTIVGTMERNGKIYKVLKESDATFLNNIVRSSPFLAFRVESQNRVLGCGKIANEFLEEQTEQALQEILAEVGAPKEDFKIDLTSSGDWVLLEKPMPGHQWTVVNIEAVASAISPFGETVEINCTYEVRAQATGIHSDTFNGKSIQVFMVHYTTIATSHKGSIEEPLMDIWLAPNIGLISMLGYVDWCSGRLINCNIIQAPL